MLVIRDINNVIYVTVVIILFEYSLHICKYVPSPRLYFWNLLPTPTPWEWCSLLFRNRRLILNDPSGVNRWIHNFLIHTWCLHCLIQSAGKINLKRKKVYNSFIQLHVLFYYPFSSSLDLCFLGKRKWP